MKLSITNNHPSFRRNQVLFYSLLIATIVTFALIIYFLLAKQSKSYLTVVKIFAFVIVALGREIILNLKDKYFPKYLLLENGKIHIQKTKSRQSIPIHEIKNLTLNYERGTSTITFKYDKNFIIKVNTTLEEYEKIKNHFYNH